MKGAGGAGEGAGRPGAGRDDDASPSPARPAAPLLDDRLHVGDATGRTLDRVAPGRPAGELTDDHPLAPLAPFGLGDVRLVEVPNEHLGATSVIALVGDPLASIAPLVRLHRGCLLGDALGHGGCRRPGELLRAFRRLREDGAGVLVYHRDDRDPLRACCADADHRRRPLGAPETSPALDVLATTIAGLGLRPARLLVPGAADPDALDPRDVRLPVVRHVRFGGARPRPSVLVGR